MKYANRSVTLTFALASLLLLSGCFSQRLAMYQSFSPKLVLEDYFSGCVVGWGLVKNWRGEVASRFKVHIDGVRTPGGIVLDEDFVYADGSRSERVWTIENLGNNTYRGTAPDVVDEATGKVVGNALSWVYQLRLPRGDGEVVVTLDDWLYLQPDGVLVNTTEITKFGISVGSLFINFQRQANDVVCDSLPVWSP